MCGIVGYLGREDAKKIILSGLSRLEYRGYDSAGVCLLKDDKHTVYKDIGRINHLEHLTRNVKETHSGIGHTRWATHGKVTKENAHPHHSNSGRFFVVHNGVIDNYKELELTYLSNIPLTSQTDTEILVNLIERFSNELLVQEAIIKTLSLVKGSYALLVMDEKTPHTLYAAKHKSPLLFGKSAHGFTIASDLMALAGYADEYFAFEDETIIKVTKEDYTVMHLDQSVYKPTFETVDLDDFLSELGEHDHYMMKEINEQPAVIRRIIHEYYQQEKPLITEALKQAMNKSDRLYILGAGTSMHAGFSAKNIFEALLHKPVEVLNASEFAYHTPILSAKSLFIFLSQSGETADLRACLVNIKKLGHGVLTITNVKTSTLAREATYSLELFAGPEIAVASTKAYTAQIAVCAILAEQVSHNVDMKQKLSTVAQAMDNALSEQDKYQDLTKALLTKRNAFYIGRLNDYQTALEAALKLKEISYIQTEGFAAGELKHGTIALIEEDTPVIAIISSEKIAHNTRSNLSEVASRGAKTLVIATDNVAREDDAIILNHVDPLLTSLITVIPTQLIAYYAALLRGYDIDKPRNLAKSVTVE